MTPFLYEGGGFNTGEELGFLSLLLPDEVNMAGIMVVTEVRVDLIEGVGEVFSIQGKIMVILLERYF